VVNRFDAVHTIAPKAGLLGMAAARLTRIPKRIHTFQGEVWTTKRGAGRVALRALDRFVGKLSTHPVVIGRSEQTFLELEGVLKPGKSTVLGAGSWGVDVNRFKPDAAARGALRARLDLPDDAQVLLFLGRLVRDKGILDLARAFAIVARRAGKAHLILVGPDEEGLEGSVRTFAGASAERVHLAGYTDTPEAWLACADVVCLPSYREGFSTVVLEAAACEAPVVASRIYGTSDALIEGVTGLFHEPGDIEGLAAALVSVCRDRELRRHMGQAGRARVIEAFSQERVRKSLLQFYSNALA
jgi:glycosyltransferase involved in cell wall biosynthesis